MDFALFWAIFHKRIWSPRFTYWVIAYFGQFFRKLQKYPKVWVTFINQSYVLILTKKWAGLRFGRFFQTHLVTLVLRKS
jgi:hypothetical protein